jgi:hypothetical protein
MAGADAGAALWFMILIPSEPWRNFLQHNASLQPFASLLPYV